MSENLAPRHQKCGVAIALARTHTVNAKLIRKLPGRISQQEERKSPILCILDDQAIATTVMAVRQQAIRLDIIPRLRSAQGCCNKYPGDV